MSRNYGTAVRQPPGFNSAPTQPVWAPVRMSDEIWCEQAGCPKRECVACKAAAHD
jgi:hypothetical protein